MCGGALRLTGCSSIYRHFGVFACSLVKTDLSVMFSAREIAKSLVKVMRGIHQFTDPQVSMVMDR